MIYFFTDFMVYQLLHDIHNDTGESKDLKNDKNERKFLCFMYKG